MFKISITFTLALLLFASAHGQQPLPFAASPLTTSEDLSVKMVEGINQFLLKETERARAERALHWNMDFTDSKMFATSVAPQRKLLAERLGISETRITPHLQVLSNEALQQVKISSEKYDIYAVRWQVIEGFSAEGLLLKPRGLVRAKMIMIPDADIKPEIMAGIEQPLQPCFGAAIPLANSGVEVLIPALVNRDWKYAGNPSLNTTTMQPHREWIYRQGYAVGRHVIGYELQSIFAAIDWFERKDEPRTTPGKIGVAGYGEGGLLALYAAALDSRIDATLVSGYFDARENLWEQPIYRNVFGLLKIFGDAELAAMAWPRTVIIEQSEGLELVHANTNATPAVLHSPVPENAKAEFLRAKKMLPGNQNALRFVEGAKDQPLKPFSTIALQSLAEALSIKILPTKAVGNNIISAKKWIDNEKRQERIVRAMSHHIQQVLNRCEGTRNKEFWDQLKGDVAAQEKIKEVQRERFWNVLGKLPTPAPPRSIKARIYQQSSKWTSYEVTLDVFGEQVFAWGILVVPADIKAGEKRPVVVCQHGLEGLPSDVVTTDSTTENYHYYKGFATQLAERGYITFAPHNPYRGRDHFRSIQRKANPLGLTLFSIIISQHQQMVSWLQQLSFVDSQKIAFYGLSYGGKTAMRVPAVVKGYALSICSADFNEWVRKVSTTEHNFGYVYTGEYDMPEWDLGHTFNYAEMAALIAPHPFMVERGHFDGVGTDEWVSYEFGKVKRHYDLAGIGDSVRIEYFTGPHSINGKGTFEFLDEHLKK